VIRARSCLAEASVDRGLQSYTIFEDDIYRPLQDNPRFRSLAESSGRGTGWAAAKPFLGKTILGQEVSLEKYKGKVLLLDFWRPGAPVRSGNAELDKML